MSESLVLLDRFDETVQRTLEVWCSSVAEPTRRNRLSDLGEFSSWDPEGDGTRDPLKGACRLLSSSRPQALLLARTWDRHMLDVGLASSTRARRMSSLRSLCKCAASWGVIDWRLEAQSPKVDQYRNVEGPSVEKIEKVLRDLSAYPDNPMKTRDRAFIHLLFDLGFRTSSVLKLRVDQFSVDDDGDGWLSDVWLKGSRQAPKRSLPKRTRNAILDWLEHLPSDQIKMFPLSPRTARVITHRYGLGNPHGLRHASASLLADKGVSIRDISLFLEHKKISTTAEYIDAVKTNDRGVAARLVAGETDDVPTDE